MNGYLILKYIHVISRAVLLGTGIGIACFTFGWRSAYLHS